MTWQVGSWIFDDPAKPSFHNASFIAINIAAMVPPTEFEQRLRRLIDEIHGVATAEGIERVLLPGEREGNLLRQAQSQGIDLPPDVFDKLIQAAELVGLPRPNSV
jgi:LDH2 family malate/lactate/ureidoglycolate dehydrogenase